jgi:hypothetical protein
LPPCIEQITPFCNLKLTKPTSYPQFTELYLDLLVGVTKVLLAASNISKSKYIVFFAYNYAHMVAHGSKAPMWTKYTINNSSLIDFLKHDDKPLVPLQSELSLISANLQTLLYGLEEIMMKYYLCNSESLRKRGLMCSVPQLTGSTTQYYQFSNYLRPFEAYTIITYLISGAEHAQTQFLESAFQIGFQVNLVRTQVH